MDKHNEQTLLHIYAHCADIEVFIKRFGNSIEDFKKDRAYYNSMCMALMQISELSRNLSDGFIETTKDQIPWGAVKGLRNWIAHEYMDLDMNIIWETATVDIPVLMQLCKDSVTIEE